MNWKLTGLISILAEWKLHTLQIKKERYEAYFRGEKYSFVTHRKGVTVHSHTFVFY
jgi:hypothetical protein